MGPQPYLRLRRSHGGGGDGPAFPRVRGRDRLRHRQESTGFCHRRTGEFDLGLSRQARQKRTPATKGDLCHPARGTERVAGKEVSWTRSDPEPIDAPADVGLEAFDEGERGLGEPAIAYGRVQVVAVIQH